MSRVKNKDSAAELSLRSALHAVGLRFFLHRRIEKVTVDVVFPKTKVAVLIDGCFWHGCPLHATYPKTNTDYWLPKLAANRERDARQTARLEDVIGDLNPRENKGKEIHRKLVYLKHIGRSSEAISRSEKKKFRKTKREKAQGAT